MHQLPQHRQTDKISQRNSRNISTRARQIRQKKAYCASGIHRISALALERVIGLKQIRALDILYPIASQLPTYKEKNWNKNDLPIDVLKHLIQVTSRYLKDFDWELDEEKNRVIAEHYYGEEYTLYAIPLCFLESLAPTPLFPDFHCEIHDLLVDFFTLFHQKTGIGCWWEGIGESVIDNFEMRLTDPEENEEEKKILEETVEVYKSGTPRRYYELLNRSLSIDEFIEACMKYTPHTQPAAMLKNLMLKGYELMTLGYSIADFTHIPEDEDYGVLPQEQIMLTWSLDDYFAKDYSEYVESSYNSGFTVIGLRQRYILTAKSIPELELPNFPNELLNFITEFNQFLTEYIIINDNGI